MDTLNEHINKHVCSFLESNNQALFENIFEKLKSENTQKYRKLLQYIFRIIENSRNNQNELHTLNIHFEKEIDEKEKTLIAEFLWRYYFEFKHLSEKQNKDNEILKVKISDLSQEVKNDLYLPSNNRHLINRIREKRKTDKNHLKFYTSLKNTATLFPYTLINLKVNQEKDLSSLFKYNPSYLSVDELGALNSFVLINTKDFNDIKRASPHSYRIK